MPRISLSDRSSGNLMGGGENHQEKQDMDRARTNVSLGQPAHAATFIHRGQPQAISHQKYTVKLTEMLHETQLFIPNQPRCINLEPLVPQRPHKEQGRAVGGTAGGWSCQTTKRMWMPKAWKHIPRCPGSFSWKPWG